MAHVLWNYDGPCRNVHGHSYRLFVTLSGFPADNPNNPKNGMVIDFSDLKRIVKKQIVNIFDHSVVLSSKVDKEKMEMFSRLFGNTVLVGYQPTCENLVADFANRIDHIFLKESVYTALSFMKLQTHLQNGLPVIIRK